MEFQRRARKDQLCILIYVLLIFICSLFNLAISSPTSATSLTTTTTSTTISDSTQSNSISEKNTQTYSSLLTEQSYKSTPISLTLLTPTQENQNNSENKHGPATVAPASAHEVNNMAAGSAMQNSKILSISTSPPSLSASLSSTTSQSSQQQQQQQLQPQLPPPLPPSSLLFSQSESIPRSQILSASLLSATATTSDTNTTNISTTSNSLVPKDLSRTIATTTPKHTFSEAPRRNIRKVCSSVHIRNDLKSFDQLKDCEIIEGSLTIALISNQTHPYEAKDFENVSYPKLIEVTEYLLFFRVQGLTQLSTILPGLSVIRGRNLVSNYALIIYEMMHLQEINLPKLTDILQGSVRIENNPNLCFVSSVDWDSICKDAKFPNIFQENNVQCNNNCPTNCHAWHKDIENSSEFRGLLPSNSRAYCWSGSNCQEASFNGTAKTLNFDSHGLACSHMCAGGCTIGNDPKACTTCRYVSQDDVCVMHCSSDRFNYKGRCVTSSTCKSTIEYASSDDCDKERTLVYLKPVRGSCQAKCPDGFEENPTDRHSCTLCDKNKCRKVCTPKNSEKPFMVNDFKSLEELSGCNVINGSVEITLKGGSKVLQQLESSFEALQEVRGYLKITRSYPILTLGFLRNLKFINGSQLDRGQYSLIIIDNPNLQELFLFKTSDNEDDKQLKISGGTVFAHLNPKLCPNKIEDLKKYASVRNWDERDVSIHTNGDKEACNTIRLEVSLYRSGPRLAIIEYDNFASKLDDPRSLLYYLINYREVPSGNVTMFDGRDGCNNANDVWTTIEEAPPKPKLNGSDTTQQIIIDVKPATRYALYVKTFTIGAGATGALSDIIYFKTAPDTPGIPKNLKGVPESNSMKIFWEPPSKPNGDIYQYHIKIYRESEAEVQINDVCNLNVLPPLENRQEDTQKKEAQKSPDSERITSSSNDQDGKYPSCPADKSATRPADESDQITFQDLIIDIVYLRTCIGPPRVKRSIADQPAQLSPQLFQRNRNSIQIHAENEIPSINQPLAQILNQDKQKTSDKIPHSFNLAPAQNRTDYNITVGNPHKPMSSLEAFVTGLSHYTVYTIEVVACHKNETSDKAFPLKSYRSCSLQAMTQVRTRAIPDRDRILHSSIIFYPANDTVNNDLITWTSPENPNGIVLAYRVRFKLRDSEHWTEVCLDKTVYERDGGFMLPHVAGSYILSVRAITMYTGQAVWSEPLEFEITQDTLTATVMIIGALLILLFLVSAVGLITYVHQKRKHELIYASVNPDYIQYEPDDWEVDKSNLIVGPQIGTGAFGEVFKGQLISEKGILDCAIKTVPPTSTAKQRMDFLREASIMKQFDTFHVVKLMGVVSATTPVYVIMEYMENGDLKEFLRAQRDKPQKDNVHLVDGIYLMAAQIADGMAYLASKKFVHRDLAARNCMVGENNVVKIGDFGLTRDVYANDYYRRDTQGVRLPVRWMPPESLNDNMYTSASDVWSYGVVVWEIVTFSAYPYQGLSNNEVIDKVKIGYVMSRPDHCPDLLFNLMTRCWRFHAAERPTFIEIIELLLPECDNKLYPNCFYGKPPRTNHAGDSIIQSTPEETNTGTESYPLLSWPNQRANGLAYNENHVIKNGSPSSSDTIDGCDQM